MKLYPDKVVDVVTAIPASQSVLVRGPHGIGKSQIAALIGSILNRTVIDLRLSQMTEGDFLGLPKIVEEERDKKGTITRHSQTEFRPPWWFIKAMNEPVVLLLDEINRAVPEVMQCAFQLVLDRAIQGRKVHEETIVIAAVNASHHYQVNEMDPALIDRFLVVDMVPHINNWKKWATKSGIDSSIIEFCVQHPDHWWHDPGTKQLEPGKVYPTPRSWEMLNKCLAHAGLFDKPNTNLFKHIAVGLVGNEAGTAFYDFVKNYDRNITAEDILESYSKVQQRVKAGLSNEQIMVISDKLVNHCRDNEWSKQQVEHLRQFMIDIQRGELVFSLWNKVSNLSKEGEGADRKRRSANTLLVHKICRKEIMRVITQGDNAR